LRSAASATTQSPRTETFPAGAGNGTVLRPFSTGRRSRSHTWKRGRGLSCRESRRRRFLFPLGFLGHRPWTFRGEPSGGRSHSRRTFGPASRCPIVSSVPGLRHRSFARDVVSASRSNLSFYCYGAPPIGQGGVRAPMHTDPRVPPGHDNPLDCDLLVVDEASMARLLSQRQTEAAAIDDPNGTIFI
jgi:hypothetical protein